MLEFNHSCCLLNIIFLYTMLQLHKIAYNLVIQIKLKFNTLILKNNGE